MICYRDRTYCRFYTDCADASTCTRPLTPEVEARAKKKGLPICEWKDKPDCHVDITK